MYRYISGTLAEKSPTSVTIDVHGIGYQLIVPLSTNHKIPQVGAHIKLLTHFVVREYVQQLYGFTTEEELDLFRMLIGVSNIGPKMAMTILSGIGIRELRQAIVDGAVPVLSAISGIGKKTAERVIIELREKIILDEPRIGGSHKRIEGEESLVQDSVQALVSLGYKKHDAKTAIQKVLSMQSHDEKLKVEDLIRQSLKYIS